MSQSIPAIRDPVACGHADDIARGREPCQSGWYSFVAQQLDAPTFIGDIGAGVGAGLDVLNAAGHFAVGIEPDQRLQGHHPFLLITNLEPVPAKAFDVVTCMDVIEHVVEDLEFLARLKRAARTRLYVTTPNFTRSKARNTHHARELTIPQFVQHYRPDELWVASPDGWHNRKRLLCTFSQHGLPVGTHFRIEIGRHRDRIIPYDRVPDDLDFTDTTVDGLEWPHMMGRWDIGH